MEAPLKPLSKPGYLAMLVDFISRAVRGQLHLPPWWLRDVGGTDFEATGREFLHLFIELGNLHPDERILEIGCGSGRMALPLAGYVGPEGYYAGMDITQEAIMWCQQNITRRNPNFQFLHTDLYNKRYNPKGRLLARDYTFPFEDESFDFIFLTSVFTHMLPDDMENYLSEIARLLRREGRSLITFFLLNEIQRSLASQGRNAIDFKYGAGPYRVRSEIVPESAIAYDEAFLRQLIGQCGLAISEPVRYGTWSGQDDGPSYQDIVLVRRSRVNT